MGQVETLPDNNLRVIQKAESTTAVLHEQLSLWSDVVPSSTSEDHPLQAGPDEGLNLRLGADVIQALNAGIPVTLRLNPEGGGVDVAGDITATGGFTGNGPLLVTGGIRDSSDLMTGSFVTEDGSDSITMDGNVWKAQYGVTGVTEVGIEFIAPPSGAMYFFYSAKLSTSIAGSKAQVTIELFHGSDDTGEQILSPITARAIEIATTNVSTGSWVHGISTLIPGDSYYVRLSQRMANNSSVGTVWGRNLTTIPRV